MGVPEAMVGGELPGVGQPTGTWQAGVVSTWFLRTESLCPGGLGDTPAAQLSPASVYPKGQQSERRELWVWASPGPSVGPLAVRGHGRHRALMGEGEEELGCVSLWSVTLGSRGVPRRETSERGSAAEALAPSLYRVGPAGGLGSTSGGGPGGQKGTGLPAGASWKANLVHRTWHQLRNAGDQVARGLGSRVPMRPGEGQANCR